MTRRILLDIVIVGLPFFIGCSTVRNFSDQAGIPTWLTWTILVILILGCFAIVAVFGEKHFRRYQKRLIGLAEGLGMRYINLKPNDADYFAWVITGREKNRDVKIEMIRRGSPGHRQGLMVVSTSGQVPHSCIRNLVSIPL